MVSDLDSRVSGLGLSPCWRYCVLFLVKTLYSHSAAISSSLMSHLRFLRDGSLYLGMTG